MRLLIVSHTSHYKNNNKIVGWGPTVMEIDYLAKLFDQVVHIAPLHTIPAPQSSIPYSAPNVKLYPVKPTGGDSITKKIDILYQYPEYAKRIISASKDADFIHVRCPANISLLTLVLLSTLMEPCFRWAKFAGNWKPDNNEPLSYRFQRFLLEKNLHRGVVSINGHWPGQPAHVYSFPNPCLTETDILQGQEAARRKFLMEPVRLVFVGRLERAKGAWRVLEIASFLKRSGINVMVDIIGDGPDRKGFEESIHANNIWGEVRLHGWLPKSRLSDFYTQAHFILLPTVGEGWPKVLSEAMAYGAVPLAGSVSSIPQVLNDIDKDLALPPTNTNAFAERVIRFMDEPDNWKKASLAGLRISQRFTYTNYLRIVSKMIHDAWEISLKSEPDQESLVDHD